MARNAGAEVAAGAEGVEAADEVAYAAATSTSEKVGEDACEGAEGAARDGRAGARQQSVSLQCTRDAAAAKSLTVRTSLGVLRITEGI